MAAADALLVNLHRDPLFEITIPSKTQAYLAAGRPVIMGVPGDASALVEKSGGGMIVEPENAVSIASAIRHLSQLPQEERYQLGRRARDYYRKHLSVDAGVSRFAELFDALVGPAAPGTSVGS